MTRQRRSTNLFAAALLVLGLSLTGCSSSNLMTSAEAEPRYEKLSADIVTALEGKFPNVRWVPGEKSKTQLVKNFGEESRAKCSLSIQKVVSEDWIGRGPAGWSEVMETVNIVLRDAGFEEITKEDDLKGGWTGISSKDKNGGRLSIFAKVNSQISISAYVLDKECPTH